MTQGLEDVSGLLELAVEADDEEAGLGGLALGLAVHEHLGARGGAADDAAALLVAAGEREARRRGARGGGERQGPQAQKGAAPVQRLVACQRARLSAGPA